MSNLNSEQKKLLKNVKSGSKKTKLKKAFKKVNQEKELLDSKKLLTKLFKSLNPTKKSKK